jgi:DnaK suppressor protein
MPGGRGAPVTASSGQLRQLMREAAARCALRDTEEALERLSPGSFGRCEQCGAGIPLARLAANPESRYYARCEAVAADSPEAPESLPQLAAAASGPA